MEFHIEWETMLGVEGQGLGAYLGLHCVFGGYKDSGLGREKGEYALKNYSEIKAVYQPLENPAWR